MSSLQIETEAALQDVERSLATHEGIGYGARAGAIEYLELHVLGRLQRMAATDRHSPQLEALQRRAAALQDRLEHVNERLVDRLRERIRAGRFTAHGLRRALGRMAEAPEGHGFDALDALVAELLELDAAPHERLALEPEMYAYQPTPARIILALIERAELGPADVLCDVGSGLGQVVILVALLSEARAYGMELEPVYCEHAWQCIRRLNVTRAEIALGDARTAPLTAANVFFLFSPFRGALLAQVLERLRREASARPIRICSYGPCTPLIAASPWLRARGDAPLSEHELALFEPSREF